MRVRFTEGSLHSFCLLCMSGIVYEEMLHTQNHMLFSLIFWMGQIKSWCKSGLYMTIVFG